MEGLYDVNNALSNGTIPDPLQPPLPHDWALQPHPKSFMTMDNIVWMAYRNSPMPFRTAPSPTPYRLLFLEIGVRNPTQKSITIISGTGEPTFFKFGRNIHRVHPNPFINLGEKGAWAYPGTAQFFGTPQLS